MIYKTFQKEKLSALGLGCMRLPVVDGDNSRIDMDTVREMLRMAFENGINYIDTAYGYHGGRSEEVMGSLLKEYPRESFCLATKFPGYDPPNWPYVREIFAEQLKKLQVDYFDFYLFHNVCEMNIDAYLDPCYGIFEYLTEQKRAGRIRHLGFSGHGSLEVLKRFLEAYGKDMEFCQIQLNYMDWEFQKAKEKAALLKQYNIPVWVMEPLRGGRLARLSTEAEEELRRLRPDEEMPAWAFRFLQSIPGVTVILSGMSSIEQLKANLETFSEEKPLKEEESAVLIRIAADMLKGGTLPCTSCRYCTSHCPMSLPIPEIISLYNEHKVTSAYARAFIAPMALSTYPEEKRPEACVGCRSCETVCPQQIRIADMMAEFSGILKKAQ